MTDLKKEINEVESRLKQQQEVNTEALLDAYELKKSNNQLQMIMKRYKKLVAELQGKVN